MSFSKGLVWLSAYELTDPMAVEPFRLRSRLPGDAISKDVDFQLLSRGKSKTLEPIQFDAAQGFEFSDFLWTQLVTPVCVSEQVIKLLRDNHISGWSTYPVEVYDQDGILHSCYHGLAVTGAVCEADYSLSTVVTKPPPTPNGRSYDVYRGLYFKEDEWDGCDMFWVGGVRVVVDSVRKIFEQSKVGNVSFTPLTEREIRVRYVRSD